MSPNIRGIRPRPRVALVGNFQADEVERFHILFPTIWETTDIDELESLVQVNELDLIIIDRSYDSRNSGWSNYLFMTNFICFSSNITFLPGPTENTRTRVHFESKNEEFSLPELGLLFHRRREADLIDVDSTRGWYHIIVAGIPGATQRNDVEKAKKIIDSGAIITDHQEKLPFATIFRREHNNLGFALLPNPVFDQYQWVEAITMEWAKTDIESFPDFGDWTKSPTWMVLEEEELCNQINAVESEKTEIIKKLDQEIATLSSDLSALTRSINQGTRRLLTAQDDELVDEVSNVFLAFGFDVINMDQSIEPDQPKREDLRLQDPSDKTQKWEAIVEVRGYQKSAGKTADLQRLSRFAELYREETGRLPDKRIYVVNGQIELPPDQRQEILAPAEEDVKLFGESGGVVISTPDLFQAFKLLNRIDQALIRESIKTAIGRWTVRSVSAPP